MPRGKGGQRAGTPGQAYTNRTDLNQSRTLALRAAPGQTYGARAAQLEAQRTIPMATPAPPTPPAPTPPAAASGPGRGAPIPPGFFGPLERPTERPNEPVTTGVASGPGAGPEILPSGGPTGSQNQNLSNLLAQIAQQSGSAAVANLAQHAASQGQ